MSLISVRNLRKSYGAHVALRDVSADVNRGEVVSVIGPSGAGKSTFVRCLNLLERPDGGEILVDGENILRPGADISAARRKMGMVFQHFNLFPHLSVLDNITFGPRRLLGRSRAEAERRAHDLLVSVGLGDRGAARPGELSGGEMQRVAIARALAMDPEIVLFDEPTSALDPTTTGKLLVLIRRLASEGLTMIIVTHEMSFARDVSTRVFFMDEGVILENGSSEQVFCHPQCERLRTFLSTLCADDARQIVRLMRRSVLADGRIDQDEARAILLVLRPCIDQGDPFARSLAEVFEKALEDAVITADESACLAEALRKI